MQDGPGRSLPLEHLFIVAVKRGRGQPLGSAAEEGFLSRAVRRTAHTGKSAGVRAIEIALKKWRGEPYTSEIVVETFEVIPPPPAGRLTLSLEEYAWRRAFVEQTIRALCSPIQKPTVFDVETAVRA